MGYGARFREREVVRLRNGTADSTVGTGQR
jgi:hypothetical protein